MAKDKDTDLSPFLAAVGQRGRPPKVIPFPGSTAKVAILVPAAAERAEADAAARTHITKAFELDALQLQLAVGTDLFERERDLELLAKVMRDPKDPTQAFVGSVDDLRNPENGFTDEDRQKLIRAVNDYARDRYETGLPEDEARLVEVVLSLPKDGALSDFVERCDGDIAQRIVSSLVRAWPTPTAQPSSGT